MPQFDFRFQMAITQAHWTVTVLSYANASVRAFINRVHATGKDDVLSYIHNLCLQGNRLQIRYCNVRNKTNYTAQITSGKNVFRVMRGRKKGWGGEKKKESNCPFSFLLQHGGTHRIRKIMEFWSANTLSELSLNAKRFNRGSEREGGRRCSD